MDRSEQDRWKEAPTTKHTHEPGGKKRATNGNKVGGVARSQSITTTASHNKLMLGQLVGDGM